MKIKCFRMCCLTRNDKHGSALFFTRLVHEPFFYSSIGLYLIFCLPIIKFLIKFYACWQFNSILDRCTHARCRSWCRWVRRSRTVTPTVRPEWSASIAACPSCARRRGRRRPRAAAPPKSPRPCICTRRCRSSCAAPKSPPSWSRWPAPPFQQIGLKLLRAHTYKHLWGFDVEGKVRRETLRASRDAKFCRRLRLKSKVRNACERKVLARAPSAWGFSQIRLVPSEFRELRGGVLFGWFHMGLPEVMPTLLQRTTLKIDLILFHVHK
jgi:hypothetical protein